MLASTRLRPQHEHSARAAGPKAVKSPAKRAAKPPAKPSTKSPSKRLAKSPAKRASKPPAKPGAKSSAKHAAKPSAKSAPKTIAKRQRKSAAAVATSVSGWGVYILRCADTTLYTGCTNDRDRRLGAHGKGQVKYTRGRLPVAMVFWQSCADKSAALRREAALKRLSRRAKLALCG